MKNFLQMIYSKKQLMPLSIVLLMLFSFCDKKSNPAPKPPPATPPTLTVTGGTEVRPTQDGFIRFYFVLNKKPSETVTIQYATRNVTASAPADYTAASGTITIPATSTETSIDIAIKGDPTHLREPNKTFILELSNPKGCTVPQTSINGTIITEDGSYLPTNNTGYATPESYVGYKNIWSDEFNGTAINTEFWNFETGNGSNGWGNQELEYYTGSIKNAFLSNGNLIIEARKESVGGFQYTSARLTTQGKKNFTFGRIDIRAKLPVGKGIWPAFWMLGSNISTVGWPACGEIDIMELIGSQPSTLVGTLHWAEGGNHVSKGNSVNLPSGDFSQEFHVFSLIWKQNSLTWLLDDQPYCIINDANTTLFPTAFSAPQFFIFNVAVGGLWPGSPDASTVFPRRMFVDYIRVFQEL
jgi:beta-glucanase (GH16 family)